MREQGPTISRRRGTGKYPLLSEVGSVLNKEILLSARLYVFKFFILRKINDALGKAPPTSMPLWNS